MRRVPLSLTGLALALALTACGGVTDEPTATPDDPAEPADPDEPDAPDAPDAPEADDLDDKIAAAIDDAAASEGVDPADIEVILSERVTWPDGALGCPEPDMMYTQALVEGYRIILEVAGDEVAYHGADSHAPERCDDPEPPVR